MATPYLFLLSKTPPPPKTFLLPHQKSISTNKILQLNLPKNSTITCASSSKNEGKPPPPQQPPVACPVPFDQQPINEYQNLTSSFPYSWASTSDLVEYYSRFFVSGACFVLFIGLPVSWFGVVNPELQPLKCVFSALSSGLCVATIAVLHIYLAWAYVGNRLLSATVEYEETGWYDGQVKPVLNRLKFTLVGLAASLLISVFLLVNVGSSYNPYLPSEEAGGRSVAGVYNDESDRSFEPDAFCGKPGAP
ncbi:protein CONSERVED IN THE GREEN LINEAGE AND DIATOMS 27, chloroplastic-like [Papaver somniferum]|uniref:protein CONSERVED IN THE GREEN LINEAGE AND DIATOMS 27, chloroplastic-like n=1 Tax=Papaver somniferum TaxID=3469 RepID=UPI000E701421|nr:protein CONSERVED IN THE GREEN LINEAGE AND DIATOMS 27, chloroplastic-like [Papaver somniferum]